MQKIREMLNFNIRLTSTDKTFTASQKIYVHTDLKTSSKDLSGIYHDTSIQCIQYYSRIKTIKIHKSIQLFQ